MDITSISAAISRQNRIEFTYDGFKRIVEPHTLGLDAAGKELLCGYQVAGDSRSGVSEGWKFFAVDQMKQCVVRREKFSTPRPAYRRDDGAFSQIIAQL